MGEQSYQALEGEGLSLFLPPLPSLLSPALSYSLPSSLPTLSLSPSSLPLSPSPSLSSSLSLSFAPFLSLSFSPVARRTCPHCCRAAVRSRGNVAWQS